MSAGVAAGPRGHRRRSQVPVRPRISIDSARLLQDDLLKQCRTATCKRQPGGNAGKAVFAKRLLHDIVSAYYAHPASWNEIGFGGPASPRGYVRMNFDRRDPWEASEARPGREARRGGRTPVSDDAARRHARSADARPTYFASAAGCRCANTDDDEEVDFAIVGTGAGGGTLACKLAEYGFSVVALDAGPYWRPLEDFASDEHDQASSIGPTSALSTATIRCNSALTIPASRSAARPSISPWCRCAFGRNGSRHARKLGYGADWPLDWREMWNYYAEVEQALKISGPVNYPWGPKRPRYPYRPHELNAAALVLAEGAEALGHRLDADAARDGLRAARAFAALRLSRHVRDRLLDQRQAERAGHLAAAGARGRRRNPRSGHGRPGRTRRRRPGHRRALSSARAAGGSSGRATSSSPATRSRRRGCCSIRPSAAFPDGLANSLRARRQEPDGAVEPGRLGH